jgi:4-hydroxy-tetrahydrodipicolinate reductase
MKIALIGYGKMGKTIEQIAIERGHEIKLIIDSKNIENFTSDNIKSCDVAIEFTNPEVAFTNVQKLLQNGIATVCGSTGWNTKIAMAEQLAIENNTALLVASNFSLGVNMFFAVNKYLAKLINNRGYQINIEEIHHTHKKDAPSGTAITIAEQILNNNTTYTKWHLTNEKNEENSLGITAVREDPAPGTHTVNYCSPIDDISITHTAHNRTGFALGAVIAAEYIVQKKGNYNMQQVLGIE